MTTKVILKESVWNYYYSNAWADNAYLGLTNTYFPTEIVDILNQHNIFSFFRERETLPTLEGLKVIDSVEFEDPKEALAFILKYGNHS